MELKEYWKGRSERFKQSWLSDYRNRLNNELDNDSPSEDQKENGKKTPESNMND